MNAHTPPPAADDDASQAWTEPMREETSARLIGAENLTNELAAEIMRLRREARFVWSMTKEEEQKREIEAARAFASDLVMRAAVIIKGQRAPRISLTVQEFKLGKKGALEVKLTRDAPTTGDLGALLGRQGMEATLIMLDRADFSKGEAPEAMPDQLRMPLAPEDGEPTQTAQILDYVLGLPKPQEGEETPGETEAEDEGDDEGGDASDDEGEGEGEGDDEGDDAEGPQG